MFNLDNQVAIVTGGANGIGQGIIDIILNFKKSFRWGTL